MTYRTTQRLLRCLISGLFVLATACGGAAADDEGGSTPAATSSGDEGGDPTEGGRRRAARGAACDNGGSADLTCQRGLFCCYQDAPDAANGTCIPTDDCTG